MRSFDKEYVATIQLGIVTDSWDLEGRIVSRTDQINADEQSVRNVLESFRGRYLQQPPVYSAKKIMGKPAYHYIRREKADPAEIIINRSEVKIFDIELIDYKDNKITARICCSSGTYIRSIAFEIGNILGCGAVLADLVRTRIGSYRLSDCIDAGEFIEKLREEKKPVEQTPYYNRCIIPFDSINNGS
jgi:tRNA pseudouridine55 synthase